MFTSVPEHEVADRLPELLARVDRGERVVITSAGAAVAELIPPEAEPVVVPHGAADLRRRLRTGPESVRDLVLPEPRF